MHCKTQSTTGIGLQFAWRKKHGWAFDCQKATWMWPLCPGYLGENHVVEGLRRISVSMTQK